MRFTSVLRIGVAITILATAVACSTANASSSLVDRASASGKITIGIKVDQPGLSKATMDGKYEGFDIEVAKYVAKQLGVSESGITWKEVRPSDRETMLQRGAVDLVVATYTITDKRKQQVDFAGPYFVAGQDLLVRATTNDVTGPTSLNGKKLCTVPGTTSAQQIKDTSAQQVRLLEYPRYFDCVTALLDQRIDAVTTDDAILAGYAAQNPELLKVVGSPFTKERYGIGLKKGDENTRAKIASAIDSMIKDGSWRQALDKYIGPSGYKIPDPPTITEK